MKQKYTPLISKFWDKKNLFKVLCKHISIYTVVCIYLIIHQCNTKKFYKPHLLYEDNLLKPNHVSCKHHK